MYKDSYAVKEELTQEAMGILGMIDEIIAKSNLYKSLLHKDLSGHQALNNSSLNMEESIVKMENDLTTYSRRLKEINEELRSHDVI